MSRVSVWLCAAVTSVLFVPDVLSQSVSAKPADSQCLPACRSGYTCLEGACVSACNPACAPGETCTQLGECVAKTTPPPAAAAAAPTSAAVISPHANATSNININVLGVLQFGPVVAYEFGKRWAGHVRLRVANLGVLTYLGFDDEETPGLAFGVGGGFRSYGAELGNMRGFYWGFGSEYLQQNWSTDAGESLTSSGVALAFDIGYRWVTTSTLYSVGAIGGWLLLIDSDDPYDDDTPFGMLVIEIGWYL